MPSCLGGSVFDRKSTWYCSTTRALMKGSILPASRSGGRRDCSRMKPPHVQRADIRSGKNGRKWKQLSALDSWTWIKFCIVLILCIQLYTMYVYCYSMLFVYIYIYIYIMCIYMSSLHTHTHINIYIYIIYTYINFIYTYLAPTSISHRLETEWGVAASIEDSEMFDQNGT